MKLQFIVLVLIFLVHKLFADTYVVEHPQNPEACAYIETENGVIWFLRIYVPSVEKLKRFRIHNVTYNPATNAFLFYEDGYPFFLRLINDVRLPELTEPQIMH